MRNGDNGRMAAQNNPSNIAAKLLPYTTVLVIIVALYVGWIFYSRWRDAKSAEEQAAAQKAEQEKKVADAVFGSGQQVRLLNFSISPIRLKRGEVARMCYGVSNAVSVTIEPHVEDTKPSYNHCLDIKPMKETTYILTAKDKSGHIETGSLTVKVQ
jgi:hypothetical protein